MPEIKQVEREKGLLKALFEYCGINNINIKARRLNEAPRDQAHRRWQEATSRGRALGESVPVAEFFKNKALFEPLPPSNYLYLTPDRTLSQKEWDRAKQALQELLSDGRMGKEFQTGIRVYIGTQALDLKGPSGSEDRTMVAEICAGRNLWSKYNIY